MPLLVRGAMDEPADGITYPVRRRFSAFAGIWCSGFGSADTSAA